MRALAVVLVGSLCATGCALVARDHACWPFVAHQYEQYGAPVPAEVTHRLAHEHGTRKQVGASRAPLGWYWRRRKPPSLDVTDVRTISGDWELAPCPGPPALPRRH